MFEHHRVINIFVDCVEDHLKNDISEFLLGYLWDASMLYYVCKSQEKQEGRQGGRPGGRRPGCHAYQAAFQPDPRFIRPVSYISTAHSPGCSENRQGGEFGICFCCSKCFEVVWNDFCMWMEPGFEIHASPFVWGLFISSSLWDQVGAFSWHFPKTCTCFPIIKLRFRS